MSNNVFNFILIILLLYCIKVYIVKMDILNDDGVTGIRLLAK